MELINCPVCNYPVSPDAKMCPHCGHSMRKKIKITKKMKIIGSIFAVAFVTVILLFTVGKTLFMPSGEKYALKVAKEVQSQLLVPDSMRVLSARAVNATQEDQEDDYNCFQGYKTWVLIYYAAENKGGGTTDDYAIGKITLSGSLEIETPYSEYDIYAATEHDSLEMQTANAWFNLDKYAVEGLSDSMELDADIINNAL